MADEFRWTLTTHAATVIAERRIEREWIEQALRAPARVDVDAGDPTLRHALRPVPEREGRVLRVVYSPEPRGYRVITAYFDRRERRTP